MKLKAKLITAALVLLGTIVLSGCDYQINPRRYPYNFYYPYPKANFERDIYRGPNTIWKTPAGGYYSNNLINGASYTTNNSFFIDPANNKLSYTVNYYSATHNLIDTKTFIYDYLLCGYRDEYKMDVELKDSTSRMTVFDFSNAYSNNANITVTVGSNNYTFYLSNR